jgi:hypothetical protein
MPGVSAARLATVIARTSTGRIEIRLTRLRLNVRLVKLDGFKPSSFERGCFQDADCDRSDRMVIVKIVAD